MNYPIYPINRVVPFIRKDKMLIIFLGAMLVIFLGFTYIIDQDKQ